LPSAVLAGTSLRRVPANRGPRRSTPPTSTDSSRTWMRWRSRIRAAIVIALTVTAAALSAGQRPAPPSQKTRPRTQTSPTSLQRDIDQLLADPALARATWGIVAKSLRTNRTLFSLNPHKLLLPASTMKIVTVAAAVDRLGWDFTYETRLMAGGSIDAGVL